MRAPNVTDGEWKLVDGQVLGQDDFLVCDLAPGGVGICEQDEANGPVLASSKSLAACLNKQMERLNAIDSWEFILRPTRQEMVEEMRKELLDAGYTE